MDNLGTSFLRTNKVFWLTLLAAFFIGAVLFSGSRLDPSQPIDFNHRKHAEAGLACHDCHAGAQVEAHASLPAISVCLMCHETPVTESPEEAKIQQAAARGEPPVWQVAARLPSHVYFSHRRHVTAGKLDCAVCHGNVGQSTAPSNLPAFRLPMERCMECHTQQRVRNDCNDCHR